MGEGLSHWSNMVLRKSQTYFFDRHTHPNSMYSNFCHVLKISDKEYAELIVKSDQKVAVWYNDNVIYPDKVRLNCYYYRHYSFWKDIEMIFATVLGFKVKFAGEEV